MSRYGAEIMTILTIIVVTVLQLITTIAMYGSGVIRAMGFRPGVAEIVFVAPSLIAFVVNSMVIFASATFRTYSAASRLALVLGCAAAVTIIAFAAAMVFVLNKWGT